MGQKQTSIVVNTMIGACGKEARLIFECGSYPSIHWSLLPQKQIPEARFNADISANFALLAALPFAMKAGRPLHVKGDVCPELLANVENLIRFRCLLNPKVGSHVSLSCDDCRTRSISNENSDPPYLMALSGGVDSVYALTTNAEETNGFLRRNLQRGVMVRGFDFPLGDSQGFDAMVRRISALCARHKIAPAFIETNWKTVALEAGVDWDIFHIVGVAAVLHLFEGQYGGAIFASDFSYRQDRHVLHWGSNSVTNAMLSSSCFKVEARGADVGRAHKVRNLDKAKLFDEILVCWAGPRTGRNCGRCTKCRRTMLLAYSQGCRLPGPFPRSPTIKDAITIPVSGVIARLFTQDLLGNWRIDDGIIIRLILQWRLRLSSAMAAIVSFSPPWRTRRRRRPHVSWVAQANRIQSTPKPAAKFEPEDDRLQKPQEQIELTRDEIEAILRRKALTLLSRHEVTTANCLWAQGFLPDKLKLYKLNKNSPENFVSDYHAYQCKNINGNTRNILDNKILFYAFFSSKIPVPRLISYVDNHKLAASLNNDVNFYAKPSEGFSSVGVIRGRVTNNSVELDGNTIIDIDAFINKLMAISKTYLITETVDSHPKLRDLLGGARNSLRILCMRDQARTPFTAAAALRVAPTRSAAVDAFSSGGISFYVDLKTGTAGKGCDQLGREFTRLPESEQELTGRRIPMFGEAIALCEGAMEYQPSLEYVGWDVIVSEQGPVMIEGNACPNLDLIQVHEPLLTQRRVRDFYRRHGVLDLRPLQPLENLGSY